jgi:methionyl-tRNA formyltransferase
MRIIFMGTPDFAVPALQALVDAGHEVVAAYSQPPRPGGRRGRELTPGPVHKRAEELGIEVRHPLSLKGEDEKAAFAALNADVAVVAAYGLLLPRAVLEAPVHGCLNLHGSILPRWRAPRRSSARFWPETSRPALTSCRWKPVWTPARCGPACARPSRARRRES